MVVKEHVVGTGLTLGNLKDMAIGDKAKVRSIDQNAPMEMYTNMTSSHTLKCGVS